ncbi:MAG: flavin monoamine oxidase family protein [Gammaproteobacteria bacterium]
MSKDLDQVDVLIVGGGLSGLHTAYELHKQGISFLLVEARDRFGGRILSYNAGNSQKEHTEYDSGLAAFDLGPSWFWPGQSNILGLINELGLSADVYMQAGDGDALYEDSQGNVQRGIAGVSMAGAYRMQGGMRKIITALSHEVPSKSLASNAVVTAIEYKQEKISSTILVNDTIKVISSNFVVLALPPRIALDSIKFVPQFSQTRRDELNAVATWMAGHAKFIAVYKECFWNAAGFSGDVISHRGPLQEIHDASSKNGELNALFGFVSVQAVHRQQREAELSSMAIAQLTRLFGELASQPVEVHLKDWAFDTHTSTKYDQEILKFHPTNDIVNVAESVWGDQLIWSGSESANNNNGFLEGALAASVKTISCIT